MAAGVVLSGWQPSGLAGQLISPGRLSGAHEHLEGMGNCTQCHQLRTRGVDPARCLACHEPLARRIEGGRGYHGNLPETDCGRCHKEHLGKDFRVVRFDAESFPHDSAGYVLKGGHARAECRSCHKPSLLRDDGVREFKSAAGALDRTFLGLPTECEGCHGETDPHQAQFRGRGCDACHDEERWDQVPGFDHQRTRYPLQGRHRDAECGLCHEREGDPVDGVRRFRPLDFRDCVSCHEDPHEGGLEGNCSGCHQPAGWGRLTRERVESSFDHEATAFPLVGAHARTACRSCHTSSPGIPGVRLAFPRGELDARSYPRPGHDACVSCHSDPHDLAAGRQGCDGCHGQEAWSPATFDLARHDRESRFPLTGAHRVTPCVGCHLPGEGSGEAFRLEVDGAGECAACHREEDPHEGAFGEAPCRICHETESFLMERFDHEKPEIRPWVRACDLCHGADQPHGDQFAGRQCGECHGTSDFGIPGFDHSGARFLLDGAHERVPCAECHLREPRPEAGLGGMVRYRPLEMTCSACHGGHA